MNQLNKKCLNLGCGLDILPGWINVDIQKGIGIDKSFNFEEFPYPLKDNEFNYILMNNVFEHLLYPQSTLLELWRISNDNAIIRIIVPYYNARKYWDDITHYHGFNKFTFLNMLGKGTYNNRVQNNFEIKSIKLIPTRLGKLVPKFMLESLSQYISNLIISIDVTIVVTIVVVKKNSNYVPSYISGWSKEQRKRMQVKI